jgi:hypothetical protein
MTEEFRQCPKCYAQSGDNWSQCNGDCPMEMSPHYNPNWKSSDIDLLTIKSSYGWTIADDGEVHGLVAGDMGYEPTGIKIPVEDLEAWAKYNYKPTIELDSLNLMHYIRENWDELKDIKVDLGEIETMPNGRLVGFGFPNED